MDLPDAAPSRMAARSHAQVAGAGAGRRPAGLSWAVQLLQPDAVEAAPQPLSPHPKGLLPCHELAGYKAGLKRRGQATFWLDAAALDGWHAPRRTEAGGQPHYSDLAIALVLTRQLVSHRTLRQAGAFTRSVVHMLRLELTVLDHAPLSRRAQGVAGRPPRVARHAGPVHLVLDSMGLQLFGQGEWSLRLVPGTQLGPS